MSGRARILLVAGEASGDRLGAGLARALKERRPELELVGMGGDEMAEAGVRLVQHASEVAVVGFVEVIAHLPALRRAMARLEAVLTDEKPDLVVPIDFPDFNLRLAARAHRLGIPIVYYVSPQVWAWRRKRVATIRELVRRILVLFPFESDFYTGAGVPVSFVGHPAAQAGGGPIDRAAVLARAGLDPARRTVALLPGSRRGEVARHLPLLAQAAARLAADRTDLQFVVPRARTLPEGFLEELLSGADVAIRVHSGDYPAILGASDVGAVASGTATLDAAIAGLPFVAIYRMQRLSYLVARRLVQVEHVALANLVAGRRVVPELIQGDFTADNVARQLGDWLDHPAEAEKVRAALSEVRGRLRGEGAFGRAADAVLRELTASAI